MQAVKELDALALAVPPELRGGVRVVVGIPWDRICSEARAESAT